MLVPEGWGVGGQTDSTAKERQRSILDRLGTVGS